MTVGLSYQAEHQCVSCCLFPCRHVSVAIGCCILESTQHGLSCTSEAVSQKRCNLATGEQRSSTSGEICAFQTHVLTHVVIAVLDKMPQPLKKAADLAKAQCPHLQRLVYLPPLLPNVQCVNYALCCYKGVVELVQQLFQIGSHQNVPLCFCRSVFHVTYLCSTAYFILF